MHPDRRSRPSLSERLLFPHVEVDPVALRSRLQGKTVLVTGASYGIGEDVARIVGAAGAHVVLVARTVARLDAVAAAIAESGSTATVLPCDLYDGSAVTRLAQALATLAPDIVVSNAGKSIRRPAMASLDRLHDVTRTNAVNYLAPCQLALATIPALIERGGQFINVSAANVLLPPAPGWAAYQASKTAFDQWLRSAAPEWRACGVAVTTIYLPLVRTRMIAPTRAYDKVPAMTPRQAAARIVSAMLARPRGWRPWWLPPVQFACALGGGAWERLLDWRQRGKRP